jgi:hypothetical protein
MIFHFISVSPMFLQNLLNLQHFILCVDKNEQKFLTSLRGAKKCQAATIFRRDSIFFCFEHSFERQDYYF